MTAVARRRLAALSEQLVAPIPDQGKFEDIPILKKIAPDSNGPRAKGKVVIVTGWFVQITFTVQCADPSSEAPILHSVLVERQHTNSRRMVQKLCTYATSMIRISRRISVSLRHCTPMSMSTLGSLMLQTRSP